MEQKPNYWLVVWNRKNLRAEEFFAKVEAGKEDFSVWLQDENVPNVRKGDKGIIVVMAKGSKPRAVRAVYATFTVTHAPQMMKDTHPQFWEGKGKNEEKMRALVCPEVYFPPITDADVLSHRELKMEPRGPNDPPRWVRSISMGTYDRVRAHATPVEG